VRIRQRFAEGASAACGVYSEDPPAGAVAKYRWLHDRYLRSGPARPIDHFLTAIGAIRADLFREHGGFSEAYRSADVEEAEFGHRLTGADVIITMDPAITGRHAISGGFAAAAVILARRAFHFTALSLRKRLFSHPDVPQLAINKNGHMPAKKIHAYPLAPFIGHPWKVRPEAMGQHLARFDPIGADVTPQLRSLPHHGHQQRRCSLVRR